LNKRLLLLLGSFVPMPAKTSSRQTSPRGKSSQKVSTQRPSLYEILGVDAKASHTCIRQAYYKLALKYHPDRASGEEDEAATKFKEIGFAYEVLSDPEKRDLYDSNPEAFEEGTHDLTKFTHLFNKITKDDIEEFKRCYVGSAEEQEDILAAYIKHCGRIEKILEEVYFASAFDEDRYVGIIKRFISKGILRDYWSNTNVLEDKKKARRLKEAQQEAKEAEDYAQKLGLAKDGSNLAALIQSRQQSRFDETISHLESKYCAGSPSTKRSRSAFSSDETSPSNSSKRVKGNYSGRK
jgi:DnaJ family protein C protein 9